MEQKLVRHHLDVFLNHFKPLLGDGEHNDPALPGVHILTDYCPIRHGHWEREFKLWSIRKQSADLSEDTLSAGWYPKEESIGYVVSDFPHFGVPIHFRLRNIYTQITEKGAAKSFSRIVRRSRNWITHNVSKELVDEYHALIQHHLDRIRK